MYKLISSKAIIGKILRDFKITDSSFQYDCLEWIGEAIECIGYTLNFVNKKKTIFIDEHTVKLPCDFFKLNYISYNNKRLDDKYNKNIDYYIQNDSYLKTNLIDVEIELSYKAFPIDEDGYPYIIDEYKYKNAISYYCMFMLVQGGYNHAVLNFATLLQLKDKSVASARNHHLGMNNKERESFKNNWTNMLFSIKQTNNYYSN